jgi:hypothetical protein
LDVGQVVILLGVGAVACLIFFQLFTRRGREWALGGRIAYTFGAPMVQRRGLFTISVNVHALAPKHLGDAPRVGIEIASRAVFAASTMPLTLSQEEARALSDALKDASEYRGSAS